MAGDVLEVLSGNATFALAKAMDNIGLCQNFMGLVGRTVWESHQRGKDIFKVKLGTVTVHEGQLRAKIEYDAAGAVDVPCLERVDGIEEFIGKKAGQMAEVVRRNPTYKRFLEDCVKKLETWALQKGKPFSQVEIVKAFIDAEDYLVMEIA